MMALKERAAGRVVVRPGGRAWLPRRDWLPDTLASIDGTTVRLITLHARQPGSGALTRTLWGIARIGWTPVVVEPLGVLVDVLERKGWRLRVTGDSFETRVKTYWPPAPSVSTVSLFSTNK